VSDDDCGAWENKAARYNTYPYLQDGGTLKCTYWVAASQNYCNVIEEFWQTLAG